MDLQTIISEMGNQLLQSQELSHVLAAKLSPVLVPSDGRPIERPQEDRPKGQRKRRAVDTLGKQHAEAVSPAVATLLDIKAIIERDIELKSILLKQLAI